MVMTTDTDQAEDHRQPSSQDDPQPAPQAPADRLANAARTLLSTATTQAADAARQRVEGFADRLGDVSQNGGTGLTDALGGGGNGAGNSITSALSRGTSAVTDKVKGAVGIGSSGDDSGDESAGSDGGSGGGGSGGGSGDLKFMNIVESMDVGVPVRVAYDQWTQFADFPSFMKKVENVEQESDEKTNWKAQVWWSHRSWESTIIEQIPDQHIVWRSEGPKGYADGSVSFHEIGPRLTRVLLELEYQPQGFVEKTANLWRAVGRRARLEFKHYRRHVMMNTILEDYELEGWRGEIRDSEVVKTHEETIEEEQAGAAPDLEDAEPSDDDAAPANGGEDEAPPAEDVGPEDGEEGEPIDEDHEEPAEDEEPPDDEEPADDEEPPDDGGHPVEAADDGAQADARDSRPRRRRRESRPQRQRA
jgi:hypothetical protein